MKTIAHFPARKTPGFTLIELLVVIAIIGVLAGLLLPTFTKSEQTSVGIRCMNNSKQLGLAMLMYNDDNDGFFTPNSDGTSSGKLASRPSWAGGWLNYDGVNPDNTNSGALVRPNGSAIPYGGLLGAYSKTPAVYKCPADRATVTILGKKAARARSVSMNYMLVGNRASFRQGSFDSWTQNAIEKQFLTFRRASDLVRPGPASTWVFIDEHEDSINDGYFVCDVTQPDRMVDVPGAYHNNACGIALADGHAEIIKWKTRARSSGSGDGVGQPGIGSAFAGQITLNGSAKEDHMKLVRRTSSK